MLDVCTNMTASQTIEFILRDREEGVELTPDTIGLSRFNEFNQQVAQFIAGSEGGKLDDVTVGVSEGSYRLATHLTVALVMALEPDLRRLGGREDVLGEIDPKRAEILARWQARSKASEYLCYEIRPATAELPTIELSARTDYREGAFVPWVKVEKYLFGTVENMGGAQKANVHVRLATGQLLKVGSSQGYLRDQPANRLYHPVLMRVQAEQHWKTAELRNIRLISFEDYEPRYDEAALDAFAAAGRRAWADVPDAAAWVRELRGGDV